MPKLPKLVRPSLGLLAVGWLLQGCGSTIETPPPVVTVAPTKPLPQGPRPLALLLPLTGANAAIGQSLLHAAQLAASTPGAPPLDVRDTGSDPRQAGEAAQAAIAAGDALIVGPLTSDETQQVGGIASEAGIPVLAFTSDPAVAQPDVWTLGVTPAQQMQRLVQAAHDDGRTHLAALLPQGPYGDLLAQSLTAAAIQAGLDAPQIARDNGDLPTAIAALKTLADYDNRVGELSARIKAMHDSTDPQSRAQAALLAAEPVKPPPFDALVIGESGDTLLAIADQLSGLDVTTPQVRFLGPALWAGDDGKLAKLSGGWYAALDSSSRDAFVQAFTAKYGAAPPPIADIAFDATLIARSLSQGGDFSIAALTKPDGFTGVDGALVLLPDGHVRRDLVLFQIDPDGTAHPVASNPGS